VVRSRDDEEVGVAHKVKPASIFPDDDAVLLKSKQAFKKLPQNF